MRKIVMLVAISIFLLISSTVIILAANGRLEQFFALARFNPNFGEFAVAPLHSAYAIDQGIRIEVIGAQQIDNVVLVYTIMQDISGENRLTRHMSPDIELYIDGKIISTGGSSSRQLRFDRSTNTSYAERLILVYVDIPKADTIELVVNRIDCFEHSGQVRRAFAGEWTIIVNTSDLGIQPIVWTGVQVGNLHIEHISLSPFGAQIVGSHSYVMRYFPFMQIAIEFENHQRNTLLSSKIGDVTYNSFSYFLFADSPIDIDRITAIIVNGKHVQLPYDSPQNVVGELTELAMEDFIQVFNDVIESHGLGAFFSADSFLLPEVVNEFSTLNEWYQYLNEVMIPMYKEWMLALNETNLIGYKPNHDLTVITFTGNYPISVYLEQDEINLLGRNAYPVRFGNHDIVLFPLELVFDALEIMYLWDAENNLLTIKGLVQEIILEPNRTGLATDLHEDAYSPVMLTEKESGLYISSMLFDWIFREMNQFDFPVRYQPFVPLIYHDLYKVVLVTHDNIGHIHYQNKRTAMRYQFDRANTSLGKRIDVVKIHSSSFDESDLLAFNTGETFAVIMKYYDYVMLPAYEIFQLLNLNVAWDNYKSGAVVTIDGREYTIANNLAIFSQEDRDFLMGFLHEVTPQMIDDVLYISHSDLRRMLSRTAGIYINRQESRLYINVW